MGHYLWFHVLERHCCIHALGIKNLLIEPEYRAVEPDGITTTVLQEKGTSGLTG